MSKYSAAMMIGQRFGRLTVVAEAERRAHDTHRYWSCVCDCGKESTVEGCNLRSGRSRSCGCLALEVRAEVTINWKKCDSMSVEVKGGKP